MIQTTNASTLGGNAPMQNFGIEMNESMFAMLTKNVYTDTVLAVMREWSTNAIDACIDANLPIKYEVNLPNMLCSEFSVRDYGTGLSDEDILGLFSMLGASTKRNSNKFNGTFGIGRMSGLAYADSFNIESYYNGTKISYLVSTDSGIPQTISLGQTSTDEPNGLKLTIAVQTKDQDQFTSKAADLYRFFEQKPTLNIPIDYGTVKKDIEGKDWYIAGDDYSDRYYNVVLAIMGNVAYEVPYSEFNGTDIASISQTSLRLEVPLGAVSITPGRESLSMDETTKEYLSARMRGVLTEASEAFIDSVKQEPTEWEQAAKFNRAINTLPYNIRSYVKTKDLFKSGKYFDATSRNQSVILSDLSPFDFTFQVWEPNRVTGKMYHDYRNNIMINSSLHFIIGDIRTNVRDAVGAYKDKHGRSLKVIVIKPKEWDKDNITANNKLARQFITDLGCPNFGYASKYYTPVKKVKGAVVRTATDFSPVNIHLNANSVYTVRGPLLSRRKEDKYYYVETSSLNITGMSEDEVSIYARFLQNYQHQNSGKKTLENSVIVGVPKNGMANIANDPRFIPLKGSMQHLVPNVNIVDTSELGTVISKLGTNISNLKLLSGHTLPEELGLYLKALLDFDVKHPYYNYHISTKGVTSIFNCSVEAPVLNTTFAEIQREYPLLQKLLRCNYTLGYKNISRYLLLEEQNKGLPNGI